MLFTVTGQQTFNTYDQAWKKIDSLIREKGLPASALTEVDKVYERANRERNEVQVIKALLYKMGLQKVEDENPLQRHIALFEKEIGLTTEPARSILQSITAGLYRVYFATHGWQTYDRTATKDLIKDDIATWGPEDLQAKINSLYLPF